MKVAVSDFTRPIWEYLGWQSSLNEDRIDVKFVTQDSREIKKGAAFFAYDGQNFKGKDFIFQAIANHAAAVFVDWEHREFIVADPRYNSNLPIFFNRDFLRAAGRTIAFFFGDPTRFMYTVAVTGTNGKTTISHSLFQALNFLGKRAMYTGTLGMQVTRHKIITGMTTPDNVMLQNMLHQGFQQKATYASIEASSHGLHQGRLEGVHFKIGIFTNLTQDHLDYHGDMQSYYRAKRRLFEYLVFASRKDANNVKGAIITTDDEWGKKLYEWLKTQSPSFPVISLSQNDKNADAQVTDISAEFAGYQCTLIFAQKSYFIKTKLLGRYNLMNLCTVFLTLLLLGFTADEVLKVLVQIEPVPGRFQVIRGKEERMVVIDYAHSPDALAKVLDTAQELTPSRVINVFGCGGDRDKEKRPLMAEAASLNADLCVITNDNPRNEDPDDIIMDIRRGLKTARYLVIPDREKAIRAGLQILGPREILVIAGKGHEDYQIIGNKKTHFSDFEVADRLMGVLKMKR